MTYELDARVRAGQRANLEQRDHSAQTLTFELVDLETDDEITFTVPAKYEVCRTCDGRGRHVNPSIDSHGLSSEDFADDPDFRDDYFSGTYDVDCYDCKGRTTVLVPDTDRMTDEQKDLMEQRDQQEADEAMWAAEAAHERRMGA